VAAPAVAAGLGELGPLGSASATARSSSVIITSAAFVISFSKEISPIFNYESVKTLRERAPEISTYPVVKPLAPKDVSKESRCIFEPAFNTFNLNQEV
jgi:hypothetical protein